MPRTLLASVVLLLGLGGVASAEPTPAAESIDALIQRSGLDSQLLHFESAMQRGITLAYQSEGHLPLEELSRMRKAVTNAYAVSNLRPALREELARTLPPAEVSAALAWLDSPTGRKLAALEAKASTPEAQQRLEAAAKRGLPPMGEERTRTLHSLIKATRADEVAATILIETAVGIREGFAMFASQSSRSSVESLRRGMEAERANLVAEVHQRSFVSFALVYAEASDAELAALLAFATSPAGARYHDLSSQAFASTLAQAAKRLGGALAAPAAPAGF